MSELYNNLKLPEPDAVFKVVEAFKKDNNERKVNLAIGVLVDENGKVDVPAPVQSAMENVVKQCIDISGYLPISGFKDFTDNARDLIFECNGDISDQDRILSLQTPGGTGALRLIGEFLKTYTKINKEIYVSNPTWGNHKAIFSQLGFEIKSYDYYSKNDCLFSLENCLASLNSIQDHSLILLHASAHNPTGSDPTQEQWDRIIELIDDKNLIPIVDCAYQGLGKSVTEDNYAIKSLLSKNLNFFVAQSFSKSLALYQQRVGVAHIVVNNSNDSKACFESAKLIARKIYSNPPAYGAYVANKVLSDTNLKSDWNRWLDENRVRLHGLRNSFLNGLSANKVNFNYEDLKKQIGMFSLLPLSVEQVRELRDKYSIYLLENGRVCVAALNTKNIEYVIESFSKVLV